jgi:hypothetical protein
MSGLATLRMDRRGARVEAFADAWAAAERDAGDALRAWWTAPVYHQEDAYVVYRAALEREHQAAVMLAAAAEAQR